MSDRTEDRRRFLKAVAAATLATGWAGSSIGRAFGDARLSSRPGAAERVLVVVQLSGGNDGLSTIVPYADDAYVKARTSTRLAKESLLPIDDYRGFHPGLSGLKGIWDKGQLALIEGVSYPQPDRSHFLSLDIWHTAEQKTTSETRGWLGRYADIHFADDPNPNLMVNIGNAAPRAMIGTRRKPVSFSNPESYRFVGRPSQNDRWKRLQESREGSGAATQGRSNLEFLRAVGKEALESSEAVRKAASGYRPKTSYPDSRLGVDLMWAAGIIAGRIGTRVIWCGMGGFDTHVKQKGAHDNLMETVDAALSAFQKDLLLNGHADRVTTLVFSEFGRRVAENASGGTDHGVAGPTFLIGKNIKGGLKGRHPSLTDLTDGDLLMSIDFREIYAGLARHWIGHDPVPVLGREFATHADWFSE